MVSLSSVSILSEFEKFLIRNIPPAGHLASRLIDDSRSPPANHLNGSSNYRHHHSGGLWVPSAWHILDCYPLHLLFCFFPICVHLCIYFVFCFLDVFAEPGHIFSNPHRYDSDTEECCDADPSTTQMARTMLEYTPDILMPDGISSFSSSPTHLGQTIQVFYNVQVLIFCCQ